MVFLDFPWFTTGLLGQTAARLESAGWLAPEALIYAECAAREGLPRCRCRLAGRRAGRAGEVGYHLLRTPRRHRHALYPGTFDPITNGHADLVRRASSLFDRVVVAIASNAGKAPLFAQDKRVALAREVLADLPNVEVMGYSELTVEFARRQNLSVIIRDVCAPSPTSSSNSSWPT